MFTKRGAAVVAVAGDDVYGAVRKSHGTRNLSKEGVVQRIQFRRLDHHRVAGGQGGRYAPGHEFDREVPRNDVRGHAVRLGNGVVDQALAQRDVAALDLVRQTPVVFEILGGAVHLVDRIDHAHAALVADDFGNLILPAAKLTGHVDQHPSPVDRSEIGQGPGVETLPGRGNGEVDILGLGARYFRDLLPGCRVLDFDCPPGGRIDEMTVNVILPIAPDSHANPLLPSSRDAPPSILFVYTQAAPAPGYSRVALNTGSSSREGRSTS